MIGHRGASGYRPEHTLASYRLAAEQGADFVEPDLVSTRDGVLVARHENEIGGTTDVASHPEFADRRTTKVIDGASLTGWFTEDFTLAELKTLRAKERIPQLRPQNTQYDGQFEVPTLQEVLDLRKRLSKELGRSIGVYPETKHPTYFRSIGLPLEEPLVRTLTDNGLNRPNAPVFVQSFETGNLRALDAELRVPLVQLLDARTRRPIGDTRTYGELATPAGLRSIAEYADGVGPSKDYIVPRNPDQSSAAPTALRRTTRTRPAWPCTRTRSGARTRSCRSSCAPRPTPRASATWRPRSASSSSSASTASSPTTPTSASPPPSRSSP